mmetsp:Transcript_36056/g.106582  ORF Transcript_36056/g.106582 Transcript_36056/m.106582 type:complete len:204 (-) Transcript_36056:230-841(-)
MIGAPATALLLLCLGSALASAGATRVSAFHQVASSAVSAPEDAAACRHLMETNTWGVIATTSLHLNGSAWGNVVSFATAGPDAQVPGRVFFYMTPMDPTLQDLRADARCTLTVSALQSEGCSMDPEDPTCAKLSMSGRMVKVADEDVPAAKEVLFAVHPQMASWTGHHGFEVHSLDMNDIFLLHHYGGAAHVTAAEYTAAWKQ